MRRPSRKAIGNRRDYISRGDKRGDRRSGDGGCEALFWRHATTTTTDRSLCAHVHKGYGKRDLGHDLRRKTGRKSNTAYVELVQC